VSFGILVALITVCASLFLAVRSYRSWGLSFEQGAAMAAAWLLIILAVAFVFSRMGG
jgi:multisubunit Na+/H+ antiporter MnhB subunit